MEFNSNSEEMKTVVETFVIEETANLIYDNEKLDRWKEIVGELGLQGQESVVKPDKSPIPFMFINQKMKTVFGTLCPKKVEVANYDATPIPLEILELVSLSKNEHYFKKIQIWYDDKSPDPFCVGVNCKFYGYAGEDNTRTKDFETREELEVLGCKNIYETDEKHYLLGKWADVKRSFAELTKMAKERFIKEQTASYSATIKDYEGYLSRVPSDADRKFS